MNSRALVIDSKYMTTESVLGSSARKSSRSATPTSSMFPSERKYEKPICCVAAQSRMAVQSAPDCDSNATRPTAGIPLAKLALSFACGTIAPRQLGPITRT